MKTKKNYAQEILRSIEHQDEDVKLLILEAIVSKIQDEAYTYGYMNHKNKMVNATYQMKPETKG